MKHFKNTFLKGAITVVPLAISLYFTYWLVVGTESAVEKVITTIFPESFYVPGMGLLIVLLGTYLIGLTANIWLGAKLVALGERLLKKVPLVKTVYGSIKDLLSYFDVSNEKKLNKPVLVYFESLNAHLLGFVTQSGDESIPVRLSNESKEERIGVYLPMSYQVGGYMLFVPKSSITELDMSIEEAMQYAITAGVSRSSASKAA